MLHSENPSGYILIEWAIKALEPSANEPIHDEYYISAISYMVDVTNELQQELGMEPTDHKDILPSRRHITKSSINEIYKEIDELRENYSRLMEDVDADLVMDSTEMETILQDHNSSLDRSGMRAEVEKQIKIGHLDAVLDACYVVSLSNRLLNIATLSQVVIENYSVELLNESIISSHYKSTNNTVEELKNLSQPAREQLLQRTGVLSGDTIGQMASIRQTRNDIVHDLRSRDYYDTVKENVDIADSIYRVMSELEDQFEDTDAFVWS